MGDNQPDNGWYRFIWSDGEVSFREVKDGRWAEVVSRRSWLTAKAIERVYILTHGEWNQRYVDGWTDGNNDAKDEA